MCESALHGKSDPLLHRAWEGLRENCVSLFFLEAATASTRSWEDRWVEKGVPTHGDRVGTDKEWKETPQSMKVGYKKGAKAAAELTLSALSDSGWQFTGSCPASEQWGRGEGREEGKRQESTNYNILLTQGCGRRVWDFKQVPDSQIQCSDRILAVEEERSRLPQLTSSFDLYLDHKFSVQQEKNIQ